MAKKQQHGVIVTNASSTNVDGSSLTTIVIYHGINFQMKYIGCCFSLLFIFPLYRSYRPIDTHTTHIHRQYNELL